MQFVRPGHMKGEVVFPLGEDHNYHCERACVGDDEGNEVFAKADSRQYRGRSRVSIHNDRLRLCVGEECIGKNADRELQANSTQNSPPLCF